MPLKNRCIYLQRITLFTVCLLLFAACSWADDRERALNILNQWTAIRWGDDNLAWVVHYPDELVEPWIASEAERRKMRPEQVEAYRKAFTDELRTGAATTVMLSVHAFGPAPIKLSPISDNVFLIDSSGKRIKPMVYEKKLDGPIMGLMQGFVFFPRQTNQNFRIAIRGLVAEKETLFTFNGLSAPGLIDTGTTAETTPPPRTDKTEEVIVRIPTVPKPDKPQAPTPPPAEEPEFAVDNDIYEPTVAADTQQQPPADEVALLPERQPTMESPRTLPTLNQKQVLDIYMKSWVAGDTGTMYSLLSRESQEKISKELFAREVSGSFRQSLKNGYKVTWVGDSAKITVAKKLLLMRSLESKTIKFTIEDGSARVVM